MLCERSSPVTEVTDGLLKALVQLVVKCSFLEVPSCHQLSLKYAALWAVVVLLTPLSWLYGLAFWVSGTVKMYATAVDKSVAHVWKLHCSS